MSTGPKTGPDPGCLRAWADAYGFPSSYCCIDLETSGLDLAHDHILQLGWCKVVDRRATENAGLVVDHVAGKEAAEVAVLKEGLARTAEAMRDRGMSYDWTVEKLASSGTQPKAAAERFVGVCDGFDHLVAHYGVGFDFPMVTRFCRSSAGVELPDISSGKLIDTAMIYKAAASGMRPIRGESIGSMIARVMGVRNRVKYSMSTCIETLGLARFGVNDRRTHDAIYDSWLCFLVFECLREMAK